MLLHVGDDLLGLNEENFFSTFNDEDEKKTYKKVLVVDLVDRVVGAEKLKKGRRGEEIAKVTSTRVFSHSEKTCIISVTLS